MTFVQATAIQIAIYRKGTPKPSTEDLKTAEKFVAKFNTERLEKGLPAIV